MSSGAGVNAAIPGTDTRLETNVPNHGVTDVDLVIAIDESFEHAQLCHREDECEKILAALVCEGGCDDMRLGHRPVDKVGDLGDGPVGGIEVFLDVVRCSPEAYCPSYVFVTSESVRHVDVHLYRRGGGRCWSWRENLHSRFGCGLLAMGWCGSHADCATCRGGRARKAEAPSGTDNAALVVSSQSSKSALLVLDMVGGLAPGLGGIAVYFGSGFDILGYNGSSRRYGEI